MKCLSGLLTALLIFALPAAADEFEARDKLLSLPRADVTRLIGSWQVEEMKPLKMIYEFQTATMAMHGRNESGSSTFELTLDADYRKAGENAVWVIGTRPRPVPEGSEESARNPSIMGIEFTTDDHARLIVSGSESFTLIRVH